MGDVCKKCGGTGFGEGGYCSCEDGKIVLRENYRNKQRESGLPPRFYSAEIDAIKPHLKASQEAVKAYLNGWEENRKKGRGLILAGPVGVGKTYLACVVINGLIGDGVSDMKFVNVNRFFTDYHASLQDSDSYARPLYRIMGARLLVLDDLGKENLSEAKLKTLYAIVNHRYDELLPTIITANLPLKDAMKALYQRLGENTASEAITSRLTQTSNVIYCRGKDLRTERKG